MDFIRKLGIKIDLDGSSARSELSRVAKAFDNLQNRIGRISTAFTSFFLVRKAFDALKFGDEIADQSQRLGISTKDLQTWSFVAQQAGLSAETMTKSFSFLNKTLGEAQLGNKGALETFSKLGINIKNSDGSFKTATQVTLEFADALKRLPTDAQRFAFAQKAMGKGGKEVALILGQGSKAIKEQMKELEDLGGIMGDDAIKAANQFDDSLILLQTTLKVGFSKVIPGLLLLLKTFLKVFKVVREFENRTGLLKVALLGIAGALVLTQKSFILLGINAAKAGIKTFLAWAPQILMFAAIAAAIAATYLIFEDLYYFLTGKGPSAIEHYIKKFFGLEKGQEILNNIQVGFQFITDAIMSATAQIARFLGMLDQMKGALTGGIGGLLIGGLTGGPLGALIGGAAGLAGGAAVDVATQQVQGLQAPQVRDFSLRPIAPELRTDQFGPRVNNSSSTNQNITNTNNFTINGTDADEIARKVAEKMDATYTFALEDFKTVVP